MIVILLVIYEDQVIYIKELAWQNLFFFKKNAGAQSIKNLPDECVGMS